MQDHNNHNKWLRGIGENYLSLHNTTCLKGILAICIIFCHLWGVISLEAPKLSEGIIGHTIGRICTVLGYLSVAVFFFLSGYGLTLQYQKRGERYLKNFLQQRIVPLYIINIFLIFFYWGARALFGEQISWRLLVSSFVFGGTVIASGWYLQSILLFYGLFFLSFKYFKKGVSQILTLIAGFFIYLVLCFLLRLESTWYESSCCLIIGVIWGKFGNSITVKLEAKKTLATYLFLSAVLFGITFIFGNFSFLSESLRISIKCLSSCFFVIFVVLLLRVLPIDNFITYFLGKISLEIYVFHGFFLMLYNCKWIHIHNWILYSVLVIVSTIVWAWVIHPLFSKVLKFRKKERNTNGNEN